MGVIDKALDRTLNRIGAIKLLQANLVQTKSVVRLQTGFLFRSLRIASP